MSLIVLLLSSFVSFAGQSQMSPIVGADLVCSSTGGTIFVNSKDKRVWMGDAGQAEGLEHKVSSFRSLNCSKCFSIESTMELFGSVGEFNIETKMQGSQSQGPNTKIEMTVVMSFVRDGERESETFKFDCK